VSDGPETSCLYTTAGPTAPSRLPADPANGDSRRAGRLGESPQPPPRSVLPDRKKALESHS